MSKVFLMKCNITAIVVNKASQEERVSLEAAFELDEEGVKLPWYVLRNHIAPAFLTEKLGREGIGWKRIYECKIVKIINASNPGDIDLIPMRVMTTDQLKLYVQRWDLNVDVDEFHAISTARQFVQLMEEDPTAYPKHLAEYRASRQSAYPEVDRYRKDVKMASTNVLDKFNDIDASTPSPTNDNTPTNDNQKRQRTKPVAKPVSPNAKQTPKFPKAVPMKQVIFPDEGPNTNMKANNGPFAKV